MKKNGIKEDDLVIGINTGAGVTWPLKSISVEKTVVLINKFCDMGYKILLLGGPIEKERNKEILEKLKVKVIDAGVENNLEEFLAIIDVVDLLVTSDTLALHVALALKKRIVCFFGPTSADEIELYGLGTKIIPNSDCYACYKKIRDSDEMCIDKINVPDLITASLKEIKKIN